MNLIEPIIQFHAEIQAIRRDLHAHPELCYEEQWTSDLVAKKLTEWNIPIIRGLGKTGVVGIIKNGNSGRAIGLRADMDALPMQELNTFTHASQNQGKMHACGHDGHTAMLLGAAHYLSQHRHFDGTVYVIFQPAEEGGAGAQRMIDDGLFEQCPMEAVFGMHNWPGMPTGLFGVTPGPMMASSNEFEVTIKGKGSHAAQPHNSIDPVVVAVQIAQSWQTIVARNIDPNDPAVLSITQIHTGSATNVIPDEATLIGTVRTFSIDVLDLIEQRMFEIAQHTAAAFNAQVDFRFHRNYPPLINHPKETAFAVEVMQAMSGADNVHATIKPTMGAEDFAFMLQHKPGCYVFLGNGTGAHRDVGHGLGPCNLHNASYDFNDELLPIGASYWVNLAEAYLRAA
ncbi:M20 aminoacylase family protein [Glaciimonas soli]|uniref:Amidohydrolase n=1 Tax=Glaciimonas soli TaxID=2590999 RepID=A0A843YYH7_9BURK|nr:M20 aminoacylase family protein [Glaciimonas soli]MQR02311.1 amidohydrolase [Glaciimonas soli]